MAIPDNINPDPTKKEQSEDPFNSLVEWSKWLITVNFAAATGCVVTLQNALENPAPNSLLLVLLTLAIGSFCLSVAFSVWLIFEISIGKIFGILKKQKYRWIGWLQLVTFRWP